jgi:hypothetical protein
LLSLAQSLAGRLDLAFFRFFHNPTEAVGLASYTVALLACIVAFLRVERRGLFLAGATIEFLLIVDCLGNLRWRLHSFLEFKALALDFYGKRFSPQLGCLVVLVCLGIFAAVLLWRSLRGQPGLRLASAGLTLSVILWGTEVISIHPMDAILYREIGSVLLVAYGWMLAAAITAAGAFWHTLSQRPRKGEILEMSGATRRPGC